MENSNDNTVVRRKLSRVIDEEGVQGNNKKVKEGNDEEGVKIDDQKDEGVNHEDDEGYYGDIDEEGVTHKKRKLRNRRRGSKSKHHKHREN